MMEIDIAQKDYGRVSELFFTKRVNGQYYYAEIVNGRLEWIRQTHEKELTPALTLQTFELIILRNTLNGLEG